MVKDWIIEVLNAKIKEYEEFKLYFNEDTEKILFVLFISELKDLRNKIKVASSNKKVKWIRW